MIELLFGTPMAVATTVGVVLLAAIYAWYFAHRNSIQRWGLSMGAVGLFGLAVCFASIFRDDYVDSIISSTDKSVEPGLFAVDSLVSYVASVGGAAIIGSLVAGIFLRKPQQRRALFFIMGMAMLVKVIVVEAARMAL